MDRYQKHSQQSDANTTQAARAYERRLMSCSACGYVSSLGSHKIWKTPGSSSFQHVPTCSNMLQRFIGILCEFLHLRSEGPEAPRNKCLTAISKCLNSKAGPQVQPITACQSMSLQRHALACDAYEILL